MAVSVQQHYGSADIVSRILAAVPWAPGDAALTAPQLYPFDQFHGRELAATQDRQTMVWASRDPPEQDESQTKPRGNP